jgi:hypothetical protein
MQVLGVRLIPIVPIDLPTNTEMNISSNNFQSIHRNSRHGIQRPTKLYENSIVTILHSCILTHIGPKNLIIVTGLGRSLSDILMKQS